MSFKLGGFILDTDLPPTETLLMLALADYADEHGRCWPSKETLARRSRVSKRTVDKYINHLADEEWLFIETSAGGRKSNNYTLNIDKIYEAGNRIPCKPCTPAMQPMLHRSPATHAAPEPPYNHHRTTPTPAEPPPRDQAKPVSDHAWFTAWWTYVFRKLIGEKYAFTKKDAGQIQQMIKTLGLGDVVARACVYIDLPSGRRFPRGSPPTLGGLLCQINEVSQCPDELIDRFTDAGLLPDLDSQKLKDFQPWKDSAEAIQQATG